MVIILVFFSLLYKKFGNEFVYGFIIAECSSIFLNLRDILPYIGSNMVNTINNVMFIIAYVVGRLYYIDNIISKIFYHVGTPLFIKLIQVTVWYMSWVWWWQIVNSFFKIGAEKTGLSVFEKIYGFLKKARKFVWFYYGFAFVYVTRYLADYYQITSLPVQIFGKH